MNKIEKFIYNQVKSIPWLKYLIRNLYQAAFDLLPRQKEFSLAPIVFQEGFFFGFHDKTPFSEKNDKLLANQLTIPLRMPSPSDKLNVGYFIITSDQLKEFIKIGESFAWNYHKGCRLQWLNEQDLIFNSAKNERLIAKIVNVQTKTEKIINYPIDTVSTDGNWATSFSYERLQELMPGYGYPYFDEGLLNENAPESTGLFLINLSSNARRLLISLKDLTVDLTDSDDIKGSRHYITHSEFSTDGKYISFLHRWTKKDIRDRVTRLVIFDLDQQNYFVVPTEGMVSHYVWNRQNQIIAYCRIDGEDCHALFNVPDVHSYKKIATSMLNSDGHQSFITDTEFLTDTYPDRFRMSKLYRVNSTSSEARLIASLHSPKKFQTRNFQKHIACDLHPRVSPNGQLVCFDAVRNGKRSLCIMPLEQERKIY
ncbi:MAG: hypothetical protein K9H26_16505 [Prolixibacteraceae bacterium]|nr:hypothetical protein [Prolixibacteraceae bacterium]